MPKLVRLYIRQVLIGFALSAIFVGLLIWQNIGNLGHLILNSDKGWIAIYMLFIGNGVVFASVQFAIMVMRMAKPDDTPPAGGKRIRVGNVPVPVMAEAKRRDHQSATVEVRKFPRT